MRKRKFHAILITFKTCSNRFESVYERNKFFKELYGWNQVIIKKSKRYVYRRSGILERIPHIKVDDSVFIIREDYLDEIEEFFKRWRNKVIRRMFEVLLDDNELDMLRGD